MMWLDGAQVTLYQLLMEERYGEPIEAGLLWYLNQASPELVTRSPYEVCKHADACLILD